MYHKCYRLQMPLALLLVYLVLHLIMLFLCKNTTREKTWEEAEQGARKRAAEAGEDEKTLKSYLRPFNQ